MVRASRRLHSVTAQTSSRCSKALRCSCKDARVTAETFQNKRTNVRFTVTYKHSRRHKSNRLCAGPSIIDKFLETSARCSKLKQHFQGLSLVVCSSIIIAQAIEYLA
ncbi:hypothetical protein RRG08_054652 [Elysia crispata]|uniref:Uncharacterized protein n=1 Tax=Elysia crispata TaxID=231223 RepID=A0AAE1E807_9GAST|nr:hypothetical protein RRG08_054652 [Elysia crispata]